MTLNPKKFLRTNLEEYFSHDQNKCMGCAECMKPRPKLLSYKYPTGMKTNYNQEYNVQESGGR